MPDYKAFFLPALVDAPVSFLVLSVPAREGMQADQPGAIPEQLLKEAMNTLPTFASGSDSLNGESGLGLCRGRQAREGKRLPTPVGMELDCLTINTLSLGVSSSCQFD